MRFVADAEDVPKHVLDAELLEELLMGGQFYESVVAKGIVKGEQLGIVKGEKSMLVRNIIAILERRLGSLEDEVRSRISAECDLTSLQRWNDLATDAFDANAARKVVQQIRQSRIKPPQP